MEISFLRHAESLHNCCESNEPNVGLSAKGIRQASKLSGHYDIVICSPLRSCLDTIVNSKITYDQLLIDYLVRELVEEPCDILDNEIFDIETEDNLLKRIYFFKQNMKLLYGNKKLNILVVTHSVFIWHLTSYIFDKERFGKWLKNNELIRHRI